jgi:hypothetical protein
MDIIKSNYDLPFLKFKVNNHIEIKQNILDAIKKIGIHSLIEEPEEHIFNSDWHINSNYRRHYIEFINPILINVIQEIKHKFNYKQDIGIQGVWFQQYNYLDYHDWHHHGLCMFSCVYYVELNKKNSKTTFKLFDNEFEVDVQEGDILIFPSFLLHKSNKNLSDLTKTVISFNIG